MHLPRPSAALVVASLALVVAVAPPGHAALDGLAKKLGKNTVGSAQIRNGSVHGRDLAVGSVTSRRIVDGAVTRVDIAPGAVDFSRIADGTVGRADLAPSVRPPVAGTFAAAATAPETIGDQLTPFGSLSTSGTGTLSLAVPSLLTVTGKLHVTNPLTVAQGVGCRIYVNGVTLEPPVANAVIPADGDDDLPVVAGASLPAGQADVALSCVGSGLQVRWVRVNVVAYGS